MMQDVVKLARYDQYVLCFSINTSNNAMEKTSYSVPADQRRWILCAAWTSWACQQRLRTTVVLLQKWGKASFWHFKFDTLLEAMNKSWSFNKSLYWSIHHFRQHQNHICCHVHPNNYGRRADGASMQTRSTCCLLSTEINPDPEIPSKNLYLASDSVGLWEEFIYFWDYEKYE